MSVWIIAVIVVVALLVIELLFMHGVASGRSEEYQQELDDIQMKCVSRNKHDKQK